MALTILDAVGKASGEAVGRAQEAQMRHMFHVRGECDSCDRNYRRYDGSERHRARLVRWLERKIGAARAQAFIKENW